MVMDALLTAVQNTIELPETVTLLIALANVIGVQLLARRLTKEAKRWIAVAVAVLLTLVTIALTYPGPWDVASLVTLVLRQGVVIYGTGQIIFISLRSAGWIE